MASPSPLLYNTYYHLYNRGVNGEDIFIQERNYELFLKLFEKHVSHVADLFAYCLLKNHFHVSVKTRSAEEIHETLKTLTPMTGQVVSPANGGQTKRGNAANQGGVQLRKPLGSKYVSDQFPTSLTLTLRPLTKPMGGQAVCSNIRSGVSRLLQIASFGM